MWEGDNSNTARDTGILTVEAELEAYKKLPVPEDADFDLLHWWKFQTSQLPRMSQLAKWVLCIPASSAPSERSFSAAGLLVNKLRTSLNPKNVDDLLLLRSNLDLVD